MAVLPVVTRTIQIGPEVVRGTGVAANNRLRAYEWTFTPQFETRDHRASGDKYGTQQQGLREWTEFGVDGILDFNEVQYILGSVITVGTAVGVGTTAAGTAYLWTYESSNSAADSPITFTIESGDSTRAQEVNYALFDSFEITIEQNNASITASGFGRAWVDNITLTATPEAKKVEAVLPKYFKVYADTTSAGLGGTELSETVRRVTFSLNGRFNPVWAVDSDLGTSFATHVEVAPDATFTLQLDADATGMNYLNTMRGGTTIFFRTEATGGTTVGGSNYKLTIDVAGQIMDAPSMDDLEGAYVADWTWRVTNDATWGKAFSIALINELYNYDWTGLT